MEKKNWLFKISTLSISFGLMGGAAIAGSIPAISAAYPQQSSAMIESLSTIPNLGIIVFVLISPLVTKMIGNKKTIIIGLAIALIAGVLPLFTDNFSLLLFARFLYGAGIGLLNPLAYSIIAYFFKGDELADMMGKQGATSAIGNVILMLIAGVLLQYGWQKSFLVYLVLLPILLLVVFKIPAMKQTAAVRDNGKKKATTKIDSRIYGYALYMFLIFACYMAVITKLALIITAKDYGSAAQASLLISLNSFAGIIIGLVFNKVYQKTKINTLPIALLAMAVAFLMISFSSSLIFTGASMILLGSAFALVNPYVFMRVAQLTTPETNNFASSILLVGINIGCFFSPFFSNFLGQLLGNNSVESALFICGLILLAAGLIHWVVNRKNQMKMEEA